MFKLALKGIMARKGRLLLTSLAVILGTSFLAGTFIFSDTLTKSFHDLFAGVFENTDAYVRSSQVIQGDFGAEERQRIPDSLTAEVAKVSGVRIAEGNVFGFARVVGKDGKAVGSSGNGPPTFGSSIAPDEAFWTITEGRLPKSGGEVALDAGVTKKAGYKVGDNVHEEFPGDLVLLDKAVPVYEWYDGWKTSTAAARTLGDLPKGARTYLDRIRELADTPISYVSVGTHRDQIIGVE